MRLTVRQLRYSCSDLFLQTTNKLGGYYFKKIKSRAALAVVRLVESEEDRAELVSRLEVMSEGEREATAVIITQEVTKERLSSVLTDHFRATELVSVPSQF